MKDIMFFDASCRVGNCVEQPYPGIPELLADMDRYGVERALVQHNGAGSLGAGNVNKILLEMLRREDPEHRLQGVWNILPPQCGELPAPDKFFGLMKENGVRVITLDPYNHRFVPNRISIGKYLDEAVRLHVPVLLSCFAAKWNDLHAFLHEFPDLHCIVHCGGKWGRDRCFRPLLEAYPGVRIELSCYWVAEGIAELVRIYGARRLLFASGFPRYNHGCAMLQLKNAEISPEDIALIAGKNLNHMLEESLC